MDIVLLILAAIAVPFTILAIVLIFSRSMSWLVPRPRTRAGIFATIGVLYPVIAVWEAQTEGWRPSSILGIILGISWIAFAVHEYRRGVITIE